MADEETVSTSYNSHPDIHINKEFGLLDGVGNEVWIGLFCVLFFIWISKYISDAYMFPVSQINNGDTPSVTSNQGKVRRALLLAKITPAKKYSLYFILYICCDIFQVVPVHQVIIMTALFAQEVQIMQQKQTAAIYFVENVYSSIMKSLQEHKVRDSSGNFQGRIPG